jgi:hypothetical protein
MANNARIASDPHDCKPLAYSKTLYRQVTSRIFGKLVV